MGGADLRLDRRGCALYLVLELTGGLRGRLAVGVCFFAFMFSIFAVSKGVPAAATALYGKPTVVRFVVTGFDWGGKNCSRNVVAKHPDYEISSMHQILPRDAPRDRAHYRSAAWARPGASCASTSRSGRSPRIGQRRIAGGIAARRREGQRHGGAGEADGGRSDVKQ